MAAEIRQFVGRGGGKVEYFRLKAIEYMRNTGKPVIYATVEGTFLWTLQSDGSIKSVPFEPPEPAFKTWFDEDGPF